MKIRIQKKKIHFFKCALSIVLFISIITACDMNTPVEKSLAVVPEENILPDDSQEESTMKTVLSLQPISIYPVYFMSDNGSLFGIPSNIQGPEQKVKINLVAKDQDGNEIPVIAQQFFSKDGMLYFRIDHAEQETVEIETDDEAVENPIYTEITVSQYFKQKIGTDIVEEIAHEDFPTEPASTRQIVNMPEFSIKQAEYNGEQVSEIWNLNPLYVSEKTPNGSGPFRFGMVDAYMLMDNGLLFNVVDAGLRFIPFNRTAVNTVSENGRMWK